MRPSHTRRATSAAAALPVRRARLGMSLVEILIASLMMTVAVMGLLGASSSVSQQLGAGRRQMVAASMAQRRLDSLQSLPCTALTTAGSGSANGIGERWTVTGSGLTRTIALELTVPRVVRPYRYTTIVPCV